MPVAETADVVIAGGGIVGLATAYYLAARGIRDVLVLEREPALVTGSTARSAGGIRLQFSTEVNIRLSRYGLEVLRRFRDEFGVDPAFRQVGYLFLLSTPEEEAAFRRNLELQRRLGVPVHWLEPGEVARDFPWVNPEGLVGATFCPEDGHADPYTVAMAFGRRARELGVRVATGRSVTGVRVAGGRVRGVDTPAGPVEAPVVVNAAGPDAGAVGRMAGVDVPVEPYRRQVFVTDAFAGLPREIPLTIDFATSSYARREGDRVLFGMSDPEEPPGRPLVVDDAFLVRAAATIAARIPALAEARVARGWAGYYEVTPDHNAIVGPVPEVEGLYVAAGFSGHGFQHGPGVGRVIAEMIAGEEPFLDVRSLSIERFRTGKSLREQGVV
ncbi:FAD-dependent oxidoreductase [Caldinitratiruptor microaerophilus]|uniref:FAD-dependent oxidoreductase n=1 Tax=Caldinitratiruptor microaerophilus TaxID=671077 RepID=A0AA35CM55_9FIRM|nr:FAD-dependent oxidoreductase [Caldinitratiruptor microaerophilus]